MRNKIIGVCALILVFMLVLVQWTPAVAGDGDGDGSGGGQSQPLSLVTSYPENGAKGVSLKPDITLTFNKNVINMTVKDNNKECLSLQSANGVMVAIEVIMADEQIEPEKKRVIVLRPIRELLPGTQYTVKISPKLQAKNGTTLDKETKVSFTTAGAVDKPKPSTPEKPGTPVVSPGSNNRVPEVNRPSINKDDSKQSPVTTTDKSEVQSPSLQKDQNADASNAEAEGKTERTATSAEKQAGLSKSMIRAGAVGILAGCLIAYLLHRRRG